MALLNIDKLNDPKKALGYAVDGIKKFPRDAKSHDVLGWVYFNTRKYLAALKQFETAVRLAKNNPFYFYHLGLTYQKMGDKTRGKEAFEQAQTLLDQQSVNKEFGQELKNRTNQCK